MSDSYSQRLKQIRSKYGASIQESVLTSKKTDQTCQSKYPRGGANRITVDIIGTSKKSIIAENHNFASNLQRKTNRVLSGNPLRMQNQFVVSNALRNQQYDNSNYNNMKFNERTSSISPLQKARDQRLKQIQQIRDQFAVTRNKAIQDWSRGIQKSNRCHRVDSQALREIKNQKVYQINPQANEKSTIDKSQYKSKYSSLNKNNIDLDGKSLNPPINYKQLTGRRNLQKQNISTSIIKQFQHASCFQQSQGSSPICGLMKFDSVQRKRQPIISDQKHYNLQNIDRIQERIHKILNKQ